MTSLIRKSAAVTAGATIVALALSALVPPSGAQEASPAKSRAKTQKKSEPAATPDEAPGAKASPKVVRRVPMYFGGLGLSKDQRESIYAIDAEYQSQIRDLERQADDLRERLMAECEDVLTAPQKKALAEARKSAADRRKSTAARRKAAAEATTEAEVEPDEEGPAPKAKGGSPAREPATTE